MVGWISPGTPASSISKTGRHDIAESGIKHNKSNQITEISKWNKIWYLTLWITTVYLTVMSQ
jgi:hypothetical protein